MIRVFYRDLLDYNIRKKALRGLNIKNKLLRSIYIITKKARIAKINNEKFQKTNKKINILIFYKDFIYRFLFYVQVEVLKASYLTGLI